MKNVIFGVAAMLLILAAPSWSDSKPEHQTYSKNEIVRKVETFFGKSAEGLADVVNKAFDEHGEPNAYIAGEEAAAALGVGVRYGKGEFHTKSGVQRAVYWQGPSVGFDAGVNAAKVFVLVYRLPNADALFQRYPGVEGSLYFVGGVGMNYLQSGETVVAPIRVGAGWRQGVSAGYIDFTREKHINPF